MKVPYFDLKQQYLSFREELSRRQADMKVPYFDLKQQYLSFREELLDALDRVCRNASFIQGEEVARFEEEFAAYCEAKHCVAVNSGTSALHLCLLAAGISAGAIQAKSASR